MYKLNQSNHLIDITHMIILSAPVLEIHQNRITPLNRTNNIQHTCYLMTNTRLLKSMNTWTPSSWSTVTFHNFIHSVSKYWLLHHQLYDPTLYNDNCLAMLTSIPWHQLVPYSTYVTPPTSGQSSSVFFPLASYMTTSQHHTSLQIPQ